MPSPDFIETYSGRSFRPLAPAVGDIVIADIAHALSQQCRFSGHTAVPYYVAQHCVLVSELLEKWGERREVQQWGVMHDASEAYLVDIPAPLKQTRAFAAYRAAEQQLMEAICERFGMTPFEPAIVRKADAVLLATEARDLMPNRREHWGALKETPMADRIVPWSAQEAESKFLRRFVQVMA